MLRLTVSRFAVALGCALVIAAFGYLYLRSLGAPLAAYYGLVLVLTAGVVFQTLTARSAERERRRATRGT